MMEVAVSAAIGYGLGQLNPAVLISKLKEQDIREYGTGNPGATNTFLVFGKFYGIAVMIFDVLKAYFAIQIAKRLFPAWLLFKIQNLVVFGGVAAVGGLVIYRHKENFVRAKEGEEILVSDFAGKYHDFRHS